MSLDITKIVEEVALDTGSTYERRETRSKTPLTLAPFVKEFEKAIGILTKETRDVQIERSDIEVFCSRAPGLRFELNFAATVERDSTQAEIKKEKDRLKKAESFEKAIARRIEEDNFEQILRLVHSCPSLKDRLLEALK